MTNTKLFVECFNFHEYFMQYWDCVNKRMSGEYTGIQCFVHASLIKNHLETQWNLRKWDGDQLKWICDALNVKYEPLNPNYFINDRVYR